MEWTGTRPGRKPENHTSCEIAFLGDRELSLKDWQKAGPTTLSQVCNIEQFHRSNCFKEGGVVCSKECLTLQNRDIMFVMAAAGDYTDKSGTTRDVFSLLLLSK